jgi:hypothetical protein
VQTSPVYKCDRDNDKEDSAAETKEEAIEEVAWREDGDGLVRVAERDDCHDGYDQGRGL